MSGDVDSGRWARVKAVFASVVGLDAVRREDALAELCGGDPSFATEVRELLTAHEGRGVLDALAEQLAAPPSDGAPSRIGRYEVAGELGRGGMGIVYRARDPMLDRFVAVKVIASGPGGADNQRLLQEARLAAALDDPAVAAVYEVGETPDGRVFLVMAYYEGETLAARLNRTGALAPAEALPIARTIAGGLAAAHARGITHGDLKPANVLLPNAGGVKILDFGIAQMAGAEWTRTVAVRGTPAYMAPERLHGRAPAEPRIDVWAFGIVLYELLAGRRPDATVLASLQSETTARRLAAIPPGLATILARALSFDPDARFADGAALAAALEALSLPGPGSPRPAALPLPLTRFVGREREVEDLSRRLEATRLLTLTGVGGTGKTRLALQVASQAGARYADGAAFAALASIADAALVAPAIAAALGIEERANEPVLDTLAAALRSRHLLLVLDNFEHVVLAAAAVSRLLVECPAVHVLVTSRAPLKIAGEQEYPVVPLPCPVGGLPVDGPALERYPATALFLDRARAALPDFAATGEDAAAVAELCARLDGLPLAIELASSRVKLLSPRAMLARLEHRLDLLSAGDRDRPARHQNLRQAIAWSYDLLPPAEQALFRRHAVFAGGCTLDDLAAVSHAVAPDAGDVLDGCAALVDHHLLIRRDDAEGQPRLSSLETLREFALERLEAEGEAPAVRQAHAAHFLALAEEAAPHLTGPDQGRWRARLEAEQDNLRAAVSWAERIGDAGAALRFGAALWRFWVLRGHLREGRSRLQRILAMPEAHVRTLLRAHVLNGAGTIVHEISDFAAARPLVEESLSIAREHDDPSLVAQVLNNLAWLLVRIGDRAAAEAACAEGLARNRAMGDRRGIAVALQNLGWRLTVQGEHARARAVLDESLAHRQAHGDLRGAGFARTLLGWVDVRSGVLERAARELADARAALERLDDRQLLAFVVTIEGFLARAGGDAAGALRSLEAGATRFRDVGNSFGHGFALTEHAEAAIDVGELDQASADLDEAVRLLRASGVCYGLSGALKARGRLAERRADAAAARAAYEEALTLCTRTGDREGARECRAGLARLGGAAPSTSS